MAIGRPVSLTSNVASKTISVTATASQTLFTVTGGYRINQLAVFRNGVRLADGSDFTARDGATVTLLSAAAVNDVLEFQIFDDFRVADAIASAAAEQTISGNLTVTGTITGLTSVTGAAIGISSGGTVVGAAKTLNFIGTGNTFAMNGDTVDISIAGGGGGGGLGTAINYEDGTTSPFSYFDRETTVSANLMLDATTAGVSTSIIVSVIPNINISSGVAVTVGAGKTMIIDVLQIGDL
tara:strand:- start:213 stop:926 length:714 start_codon:yes stop_codon:yes gene_type:complete